MIRAWFKFFRIVNLPTVPGDALVGAAVCGAFGWRPALVSVLMYLFGLAQNDILGAKTDAGRPIPEGKISLRAAKDAAACCWIGAAVLATVLGASGMPFSAWIYIGVMTVLISAYNVTKRPILMGLCRGCGVLFGAAWAGIPSAGWILPVVLAAVWTAYIAGVTKYSEGEELDEGRRRTVGFLIGALVYLQLITLIILYLIRPECPALRLALLTGAALLVLLRLLKHALPEVSAS